MNGKETILLLKDNRLAREDILNYFLVSPAKMAELVKLSINPNPYPIQEHATWTLIHATAKRQSEFEKYQPRIIDHFLEISPKNPFETGNQTVLRNLCKVLTQLPLIDYRDGELLDQLIAHLKNEDNKVALHAYSLLKINQFVKKHPALKPEIAEIIQLKKENGLVPSIRQIVKAFEKIKG